MASMMRSKKNRRMERRDLFFFLALILVEGALFLGMFFLWNSESVEAGVGRNLTVITYLEVGNVYPEILNITTSPVGSIDLVANGTVNLTVYVIARDYNGEADIVNINVTFYDFSNTTLTASDDNNNHYSKNCSINASYGDAFEVNATCIFQIWYYAHNATWNLSAVAIDNTSLLSDYNNFTFGVNSLLALGLPESINYGRVNATAVSDEKIINVTNYGNVALNLTLRGYGSTVNDGNAMNCTLGSVKNISIEYEKYNLTTSYANAVTLSQFEQRYVNLTSAQQNKTYNLYFRMNDTYNEAVNFTYWRIYVPKGVAGNCTGNIEFAAVQGQGS